MNTKPIPILITLTAAFISCLASVIQGVTFAIFTRRFLLTVLCFAIIGIVVRVVVERSFKTMEQDEGQSEEESDEEAEDTTEETEQEN